MIETKVLKQLVRDVIQPDRDLGHSDRHGKKVIIKDEEQSSNSHGTETVVPDPAKVADGEAATKFRNAAELACEDCQ